MGALTPNLNTEIEECEPENQCSSEINLAGHVNECWCESDGYQQKQRQDDLAGQCFPFRLNDCQHLYVATFVIFPVHPGDGMEMGKLPQEQHAKQNPRFQRKMSARRCKADERRHCAWNCAHRSAQ